MASRQTLKNPDLKEMLFQHAFTCFHSEDMPTHSHLQEFLALESHGSKAEDCCTLAKLLNPWSAGGNDGPILDDASNIQLDVRW